MDLRSSSSKTIKTLIYFFGPGMLFSQLAFSLVPIDSILKDIKNPNLTVQSQAFFQLNLYPDQERLSTLSQIATTSNLDPAVRAFSLLHISRILRSYYAGVNLGNARPFFGIPDETVNRIQYAADLNLLDTVPEIARQAVKVQLSIARIKNQLSEKVEALFRSNDPNILGAVCLDLTPDEWKKDGVLPLELSRKRHIILVNPRVQKVVLQELIGFLVTNPGDFQKNLEFIWNYYTPDPFRGEIVHQLLHSPNQGITPVTRQFLGLTASVQILFTADFQDLNKRQASEQYQMIMRAKEFSTSTQILSCAVAINGPGSIDLRLSAIDCLSSRLIKRPDPSSYNLKTNAGGALRILVKLLKDTDIRIVRLASSKAAEIFMSSLLPENSAFQVFRKLLTHSDPGVVANGILGLQRLIIEPYYEGFTLLTDLLPTRDTALHNPHVRQAIIDQINEALPLARMANQVDTQELEILRAGALFDFGDEFRNLPPLTTPPPTRVETQALFNFLTSAATSAGKPQIRLANLEQVKAGGLDFSDAISVIRLENMESESESDEEEEVEVLEPMPDPPKTLNLPPIPESQESILQTAPELDKETQKLHLDAKKQLKEKLRRKIILNGVFDLSKDYAISEAMINLAKLRPHSAARYGVNYDYIAEDPYLIRHSSDINQLYPNPIDDQEWEQMKRKLSHAPAVQEGMANQLNAALSPANSEPSETPGKKQTKQTVRKRIKRLIAYAKKNKTAPGKLGEHNTPLDDLVFFLSGSAELNSQEQVYLPRCLDGLQDTLAEYEDTLFSEGKPNQTADFISRVFTDYKMNFIKKYGDLNPESSEFKTTAVQILRQRMLFPLGLRGSPTEIAYPSYGDPHDPALQPWEVMSKFLAGGKVRLQHRTDEILFEAYTVDQMVKLLNEARRRGFVDLKSKNPLTCEAGIPLTNQALTKMAQSDEHLSNAYQEFVIDMDEPNPYFEKAPSNEFAGNIRVKNAFWLYLLEKHGYILRASKGKKRIRSGSVSPKTTEDRSVKSKKNTASP